MPKNIVLNGVTYAPVTEAKKKDQKPAPKKPVKPAPKKPTKSNKKASVKK